jgi:hypothetical protein
MKTSVVKFCVFAPMIREMLFVQKSTFVWLDFRRRLTKTVSSSEVSNCKLDARTESVGTCKVLLLKSYERTGLVFFPETSCLIN